MSVIPSIPRIKDLGNSFETRAVALIDFIAMHSCDEPVIGEPDIKGMWSDMVEVMLMRAADDLRDSGMTTDSSIAQSEFFDNFNLWLKNDLSAELYYESAGARERFGRLRATITRLSVVPANELSDLAKELLYTWFDKVLDPDAVPDEKEKLDILIGVYYPKIFIPLYRRWNVEFATTGKVCQEALGLTPFLQPLGKHFYAGLTFRRLQTFLGESPSEQKIAYDVLMYGADCLRKHPPVEIRSLAAEIRSLAAEIQSLAVEKKEPIPESASMPAPSSHVRECLSSINGAVVGMFLGCLWGFSIHWAQCNCA